MRRKSGNLKQWGQSVSGEDVHTKHGGDLTTGEIPSMFGMDVLSHHPPLRSVVPLGYGVAQVNFESI